MNWISDLDDLGIVVLGLLMSLLAGVLGTVIGGSGLGSLSAVFAAILFGTLLKAAHDAH